MNFIDLFSGIGGFRLGMERAGHTCLGHVEIDKFANASYEAIFRKDDLIGTDITTISNEKWREYKGKVQCICGGFPCQAFSIAGHRKGFEDTRGTLFFEILRAAKEIKPSYLFLENVKGLLSHNKGETFQAMLCALDELGYDAEWCVLNSKDFGVPQNRERLFIIGHLRGKCTRKIFSIGPGNKEANDFQGQQITTNTLTTRYPESQGVGSWIVESRKPKSIGNINPSQKGMNGEVYLSDRLCPTLTTNKGKGLKIAIPVLTPDRIKKRQNGRRFKENGEPAFTLTAQDRHGVIVQVGRVYSTEGIDLCLNTMQGGGREPKILTKEIKIRKLTPRECWRLQGFPDWAFDKAKEVNSDSQLYKQAGNSVTVSVIEWIAKRLKGE
ncbi:MAG: DNA cytosine methyltransferase [Fusobacterium sp.]|uniref:DNA cytosine methyltransferase n=1 Tax=Fusobacterium sp. TaxID=68766 RepID=UPI0026DC6EBE|nr:DNA cytosine methyltransferase [Fusobacterium sp.]MDO4690439.1 DNA cytosine methyltransferase [Fusobacterium sp.]